MRLAVASGKGGTGKTTVAANLAYMAARVGREAVYVDCDVEAPNGGIFLAPTVDLREPVTVQVPRVDESLCTHCGACAEVCQFGAIAPIGDKVLLYLELCHACGGCSRFCPAGAITEVPRRVGERAVGAVNGLLYAEGRLDVGEVATTAVIEAVKSAAPARDLTILDAPPGTTCPVVDTVRDCDYLLLVTEPTPFGLWDLRLAVRMAAALGLPHGVVINRAGIGDDRVEAWCGRRGVQVVGSIPDSRQLARLYAKGNLAARADVGFARLFEGLLEDVLVAAGEQPRRGRGRWS
jgi:MinD superfamily P-loop ATPase